MGIIKNNSQINPVIDGGNIAGIIKNGEHIYRYAKDTFRRLILKNSVLHEGNPDFTQSATTDEGLYSMEDDYGISYYFRGAVDNNYVKFGGFYWRIVRINGDGSIRIIYDGTHAHTNNENNDTDRFTHPYQKWNLDGSDAKYVGYMYGGSNGSASISKTQAQSNSNSSFIKETVDTWYKKNIVDKGFAIYVSDEIFCNDRSMGGSDSTFTNLGYGIHETNYAASTRLDSSAPGYVDTKPTFKCKQKNDAFTVNDTTKGNGALTYPIGLITADEMCAAGCIWTTANDKNYLCKGFSYWTMTPYQMMKLNSNYRSYVFVGGPTGRIGVGFVNPPSGAPFIAPVINLKAELDISGTGTMIDPYKVVGVE